MSIVVYSQEACIKCRATLKYLDKLKLPYQVIDMSQDAEAKDYVTSLGYKVAPVVVVDDTTHWSDFRLEKILALKQSA